MARRVIQDLGNRVYCDFCGDEWTERSDPGGFLFGTKAACPSCAPKIEADAAKFDESHLIRARPLAEQSFADFCRELRGGNNQVVMLDGEDFERAVFSRDSRESEAAEPKVDAVRRAVAMMSIKRSELPALAWAYALHLARDFGMCGETFLTAFAHYAQCVEGYTTTDEAYVAPPTAIAWFEERKEAAQ